VAPGVSDDRVIARTSEVRTKQSIMAGELRMMIFAFFVFTFIFSRSLIYAQDAGKNTAAVTPGRDNLPGQFKAIAEENAKFRDEIAYMQNGIINLDNARKTAEETNRAFSERMAELHDQLQAKDKKIADLEETIGGLKVERAEYMARKKTPDKKEKVKSAPAGFRRNKESSNQPVTDAAMVKERITNLNAEDRIWGEPYRGGIPEKTGRLW
jgi:septal ring factor EnvC (AmiA/AmiB activator)